MPDLPQRIGLCPAHADEFYYPLSDGEGLQCPCCRCSLQMVVYERAQNVPAVESGKSND